MSEAQTIDLGYKPRPLQAKLHKEMKRFNVIVAHRRWGKTTFAISDTVDRALRNPKKSPQYAYLSPTYGQSKRVAWDLAKDICLRIPGAKAHEQELRIDIPRPWLGDRLRIMLLGAENPGTLRGIYLDGCILDEYAEMDPVVWTQVIRPALSDRLGWATFIGTPKGQNHFQDIYNYAVKDPTWYAAVHRASETNILPFSELAAARREMSEEDYAQEYECSFSAAVKGAYYAELLNKLEKTKNNFISRVPYDPNLLVDTYWDLGVGDSTAVWFVQRYGREIRVIDYLEEHSKSIQEYYIILKEKGYTYGEVVLPHDAKARSLETGRSREESFRNVGFKRVRVLPRLAIEDGIQAVRTVLPQCYFDSERTKQGLLALKSYSRKWDSKNKVFLNKPRHDWSSHGADAFRQLALGIKEEIDERALPEYAEREYDEFAI
jgi:phage terminase large subunit